MRQAAAFVALTFALSWAAWGAAIVTGSEAAAFRITGAFGPTVVALILAAATGRGERSALLGGFLRWRAPAWAWLFGLLSTAGVGLAALALHAAFGKDSNRPEARALALEEVRAPT